ncbi:MAG TPA: glycosyltransferase [Gaiellaceae bacterium]|nr:glycosyltransferase [Gaiellaceae bacterium]
MSEEQPLVSICMPAFNAERWIAVALESALGQTYADFELVLADNGSTDRTLEIARSFDDPRIRIETATETIGAVANHNRAIRLSRGAFVKLLHADDLLHPDCVEAMVELAFSDDAIGLVFAPREVLLEEGSDPEWAERFARPHERFERLEQVSEGRDLFRQLLAAGFEENWIGEPSAVLLRRRTLERVGLFNERLYQIADLELWARIAYDHRLAFVDRYLSVYRHHEQSGTAENARARRDWFDRMWLLEGLLTIPNLTEEDRRDLRRLRRTTLRQALRSQVGRLVQRRWTPELPSYLAYRTRAGVGEQPRLHEALDHSGAAEAQQVSTPGS